MPESLCKPGQFFSMEEIVNGVEQMVVSPLASRSRSLPIVMGAVFCAVAVLALILAAPSLAGPLAEPSPAGPLDLTLSKDASPARVVSGGLVTYTVVFTNNTDQVNTLDAITDTLDASLAFEGMLAGSDVLVEPVPAGEGLVWEGPLDVPPHGTLTLLYQARAAESTTWSSLCNSVGAAAGDVRLGPEEACVTAGPEKMSLFLPLLTNRFRLAHFTLAKTASAAVVGPGEPVTYTVTVENIGSQPGTLATVVDVLPAGFAFHSMAPGSDVTANPLGTSGTITWSPAESVQPGDRLQLIYRATASQTPGTYSNQVSITSGDVLYLDGPASAVVNVGVIPSLVDHFEAGIGLWTPFLNYHRLEPGQWYWGPTDGVGGSGAATHNCCISAQKEAADALLMYMGAGAEDWTDYRVETKLLLSGGVDKEHNWSLIDGDPIGLWVRGQYEYEEGVTIRAQWVTGYYVVVAGKPDRDNLVVRLTQIQTLDDCVGDACENPQNLYCFNNVYVLAETPLYKPFYREQWYTLAVEVRGPRIVVWLDDEKVIDHVDTKEPFLKGTVGFKTHETWTASFDDLIVTPLD